MNIHTSLDGLTDLKAQDLLAQFGPNELPQSEKESFWARSSKLLKEPMLLLLVVSAGVYLVLGDLAEGVLLGASVFVVVGISFYQERKSENALAALRDLSSPRALVVRGGSERRISANQLVPGDLVLLHEGDRVPADGSILQSTHLNVDESLLTGESFPVRKSELQKEITEEEFNRLDSQFKVFSSTLVVSGTAFFRVFKTGRSTEVGKVGVSLQEKAPTELNLAREIAQIVRLFAWSGSILCVTIIVLYGLSRGDWLQAFLIGLATQMSLLPEEFPVVLAIFLAMGAWRLSKIQVLIRRPGAIERLGAVTVLCVDKTGTLTQNQMTVGALANSEGSIFLSAASVSSPSSSASLAEEFHEVSEYAVLASHQDPFDPMERAIRRMLEEGLWGADHLRKNWELIRDYPLSGELLAMSCVWKKSVDESYVVAAKGAPEAMIDLCHLTAEQAQNVLHSVKEMAERGLRVLGVAKASFEGKSLPAHQHAFEFQWLGLVGLQDPLRQEVPQAVQRCRKAGIRVVMMTGDYPETALNIAEKAGISAAGISTEESLITGAQLNSLSDEQLTDKLKSAHIFARMVPEQKLRIVKLLKNQGHVVAMTGDGVNDAPSLKWADIGIAMGARGTDVAREASGIVLLDDNFTSIVSGIERGRVIFSNIKKAMSFIVSIHVPIAGLSLLPVLLGWSPILLPIHIVFLELIIDPACSLMFEAQEAEEGTMERPPRVLGTRLFSGKDLLRSSLQGGFVFLVVFGVLWYTLHMNHDDPARARALAFIVLAMSIVGLIFADMSGGSLRQMAILLKRRTNGMVILGVGLSLFLVSQVSSVRSLFHFGPLRMAEFAQSLGFAFFVFVFVTLWNKISRSRDAQLQKLLLLKAEP